MSIKPVILLILDGLCNAVLVEHVVAFNYSSAPERFKVIAEVFGIDCRGLNHRQICGRLVDHLIALKHAIGFHETLGLHGVRTSDIPFLSQHAMDDPCILTNPRVLHTFFVTGVVVALMVYVVMPRYSKLMRHWLHR